MKNIYRIQLLSLIYFFGYSAIGQSNRKIDFGANWMFTLNTINDYSNINNKNGNWRMVQLPHDWSIEGKFDEHNPATAGGGALPGGIGWYKKTFLLPQTDKGKKIFIDFDGIYRNSEVWINQHYLGKRPNGYISFRYDLSPFLHFGAKQNVIIVKVDNSNQPNSRWYSGSGIYRNVWLVKTAPVHVDHWGSYITSSYVSTTSANIKIQTTIKNESGTTTSVILKTIVYDKTGKVVTRVSSKINVVDSNSITHLVNLKHPHLWQLEDPYLYKSVTTVLVNGKISDQYTTKFGIRYFDFDVNKGFSLNGKRIKILGVCNHQDLGALGSAVNKRALQRQLELLKAMGCNGIRTSHNPPAPELLDLCDEMGFIVMDEAFDMWAKPKTKFDYHLDWKQWHKKDLQDQLLRDRNHPSVFIWSVGNEIPEQGDTSGSVIARELVNIVKQLDTTREIVTANDQTWSGNNIIKSGAFDLIGYNYHQQEWGGFQKKWPGKKLIITESTSALETRGYYDLVPVDTIRRWPVRWDISFVNPNKTYTVSAYDHVSTPWGSTHEESIKELLKYDFVSGMYIWTGFDYLGEPTPYTWPARSSYFGIIDLAGFPKDVYYLYQSIFTSRPVLHLQPHWNWKAGDTVDVVCYYNNADKVELFLNGRSLGAKNKSAGDLHITWRVPFVPGTLKAVSIKNDKEVLTTSVSTATKPARIQLKADRSTIHADGKDLSFITATVVDKNGIMVPDADNVIQFKVSGKGRLEAVDSGDPISHESFKSDKHTALNGLVLGIVRSTNIKGNIHITVSSPGLEDSSLIISND